MADGMAAVAVAAEFREELGRLDEAAVQVMLDAWRGVDARLVEEMERFAARLAGQELTPGQVLRMERYQALYAQVERELGTLEGVAAGTLEAGMRQAVGLGASQARYSLEALGLTGVFDRSPGGGVGVGGGVGPAAGGGGGECGGVGAGGAAVGGAAGADVWAGGGGASARTDERAGAGAGAAGDCAADGGGWVDGWAESPAARHEGPV